MATGIHVVVEDADNDNSGIAILHWLDAIIENVRCGAAARGGT